MLKNDVMKLYLILKKEGLYNEFINYLEQK